MIQLVQQEELPPVEVNSNDDESYSITYNSMYGFTVF